jgi:ubiquinone biosynthesis protein
MIDPSLTPTRLLEGRDRPPVIIREAASPSRWRGAEVLWRLVRLAVRLWGLGMVRRLPPERLGAELRRAFEDLGGLWVNAGHLLSLRIDIYPAVVCTELASLQARRFGFPTADARRVLEEDLGAPVDRYFDEFDDTPFAVAHIAQVHRARLRQEQKYVAVKIQQPHVAAIFARDLAHIRRIVTLIKWLRIRPHLLWDFAFDELKEQTTQELNFHYEASAIRRMRKALKGQKIEVPELFARYSTRRVLVTEFIHAALMSDLVALQDTDPVRLAAWLSENNVEPRRVARRLIFSTYRQILEQNLYHGDLNPRHIVLLRDSRLALIEFTATTFTEREYLEKFRLFVKALAMRDYSKAADVSFMLCAVLPNIDTEEVKEELVRSLRAWATRTLVKELPYREKSIDNAFVEVLKVLVRYRCTMQWGWLRIRRAVMTLDMSLDRLYPDVNYTRVLQQYFAKAESRAIDALVGPELVRRSLGGYLTALNIQDRVDEYTMFQGALVRRHAQVFKGATNKAAAVFATLVGEAALLLGLLGATALVVFLEQRYPDRIGSLLGPQLTRLVAAVPYLDGPVWFGVLLVIGYAAWSLFGLRRRLQQKDVRPHERVAAV